MLRWAHAEMDAPDLDTARGIMIVFALRTLARSRPRAIGTALFFLASIGAPLKAQDSEAKVARSCLDTLSPAAFVRVPVYVEDKAADSSGQALLPGVDTLALHVAAMIRSSLSESTTSLPEGEMLLQWRHVGGAVRIYVHRDGRFTLWTPPVRGDTLYDTSRELLVRSLAALGDAGRKIGWPPDVAGDSAAFDIGYRWPDVAPDGTRYPFVIRSAAIPVFSMAMPRSTELVIRRPPRITYPSEAKYGGVGGVIILQFVVDSTGHVMMNTVKDQWPTDRPRLAGWSGSQYQAFVNAAKLALSDALFDPARVGGCPVSQLAVQPFTFTLSR
jgi:hypothetical protein